MPHQERPRLVPRLAGSVVRAVLPPLLSIRPPLLSIFDPGLVADEAEKNVQAAVAAKMSRSARAIR